MDPNADILAVENSLVAHFVGEFPASCDRPVAYVLQRDGLWERRVNALGTFIHCVAPAHVPGLPFVLDEGFDLAIPRIPTSVLWEAIAFFREVYFRMRTESIVRVVYDARAGSYFTDCPSQIVSSASVAFDRCRLPSHQMVVADIHSHAGMKAGFSGVDDADELGDRFYGVVGALGEAVPQMAFRLAMGGTHMSVPMETLFDLEHDPVFSCSFPQEWLDRVTRPARRTRQMEFPIEPRGFCYAQDEDDLPYLTQLMAEMDEDS